MFFLAILYYTNYDELHELIRKKDCMYLENRKLKKDPSPNKKI